MQASAGTATAALKAGGYGTASQATTEEWNDYSGTNPAPDKTMLNEGQIWYNTAGAALKYTASIGAWASSPSINSGRTYIVGAGTNTAGIIFGGGGGKLTETFDGTAWTEVNDLLATTSQSGGATSGTSTATLSFGMPSGVTETYNGTSWTTAPATMGTGRYTGQASGGTATAAIAMGGSPYTTKTEIYNGSTWTEVNSMLAARGEAAGCGSTASAIRGGGRPPGGTGITELYDGTSWSVTGTMNTGRYYQSAAGDSGTAALMFAGIPPPAGLRVTESFDGTSWTELADLSTVSAYLGGGVGNSTAAIAVSTGTPVGGSPSNSEVWTYANTVKTVTVS